MLGIFDWTTPRYRVKDGAVRLALPAMLLAAIAFPTVSSAAIIDWNAASGDWSNANNWIDYSTGLPPALPPGAADDTEVRNNGTVTLSTSQSALNLFLGFARNVELDPIGAPGVMTDLGLDGAMNWTGGTLTTLNLRIGKEHNGTVTQSGGAITLPAAGTTFRLGDSGTPAGTGTYTMTAGSITMDGGTNGNNGIEVINGTFNMKGGTITQTTGVLQRVFRVGTRNLTTATANISGGTVNAPMGGIRLGDSGTATGVLNVNQNDGTTNITLGGDLVVGRSATGLGKMTMGAGTMTIGTTLANARLQVGNSGPGQFDMTGGSIDVFNGLRIGQAPASQGSYFNLNGGTLTTRAFDSRTDNAVLAIPETTGSRFTIDGGTYNQIAGTMDIGTRGKILVELKSGSATVPALQMGANLDTKATLSISGGTFTLNGGSLGRSMVTGNDTFGAPMTAPVVNLTGGALVLNPTASPQVWQADFINAGSQVTPKTGSAIQISVGDATHPGNVAMSSGILNIDLSAHSVTGADRFLTAFAGSTASLTGGTLNLTYLGTYGTPLIGDSLFIMRQPSGTPTLNAAAVTINAPSPDPNWTLQTVGSDIRLVYVPEPGSCVLVAVGLMMGMAGFRRRS